MAPIIFFPQVLGYSHIVWRTASAPVVLQRCTRVLLLREHEHELASTHIAQCSGVGGRVRMQGGLSGLPAAPCCYEELLAAEAGGEARFRWVEVDEDDACGLCYTSGTTGRPKARSPRLPG